MDKQTRIALVVLFVVIAAWRFARYMRLGLSGSRRRTSLGVAGGLIPQDSDPSASAAAPESTAPAQSPVVARIAGLVVSVGIWLAINALLWYCLLELPPLNRLPPVPVGVAGILANFYLIPLARRAGASCQRRFEGAQVGTGPWPERKHLITHRGFNDDDIEPL